MANLHTPKLSAAFVRTAPAGKHTDAHGLMLYVKPSGTRSWVQRLVIQGKRRDMGLGAYPLMSLADARIIAFRNRQIARQGGDPRANPVASIPTFAEATRIVHSVRAPDNTQWLDEVARHVFPAIGHLTVTTVTTSQLMGVFEPIWMDKPVLAARVRSRVERVMDWAVSQGHRPDNPAGAPLRANLRKQPNGKHHRTVAHGELHKALDAVRKSTSSDTAKLAFEFLVLTATRKRETLEADWSEIDLDARTWTIPGARMKMRRDHRIPLSSSAMALLGRVKGRSGLVFRSSRGKALDGNTLNKMLAKVGVPASPHGFRSTFKAWCRDNRIPEELSEACLAHVEADKTVAAYSHGTDMLERRRAVMQGWSEYVTTAP